MFLDRKGLRVFVYRETVDMRCGFERLHSYCVHQMNAIMDQGHVYLFFGKNRKRIKILVYDGTGLVLIAKRIERGKFMSHQELLGRSEISQEELKLVVHGSVIRRPILDRSLGASMPQREQVALPTGLATSYL
ncbi:MAG: IS66 family insertion sequence element accessory protein TnpB [Pseudobdellovibrionaceae bacterium]